MRYTGMVQRYPTSLQRAIAPTELPGHSDNKLRQVLQVLSDYASPILSMCIDSVSGRNILLPSRSFHRPLGKGAGR